jgi:hypothetical protein
MTNEPAWPCIDGQDDAPSNDDFSFVIETMGVLRNGQWLNPWPVCANTLSFERQAPQPPAKGWWHDLPVKKGRKSNRAFRRRR